MIIQITDENYFDTIIKEKVVVDCWANWCGVCKMMKPKFEELSTKYPDIQFCTLNVDEAPKITSNLNITNVPTFIIYQDGKEVNRGGFDVLNTL